MFFQKSMGGGGRGRGLVHNLLQSAMRHPFQSRKRPRQPKQRKDFVIYLKYNARSSQRQRKFSFAHFVCFESVPLLDLVLSEWAG